MSFVARLPAAYWERVWLPWIESATKGVWYDRLPAIATGAVVGLEGMSEGQRTWPRYAERPRAERFAVEFTYGLAGTVVGYVGWLWMPVIAPASVAYVAYRSTIGQRPKDQ